MARFSSNRQMPLVLALIASFAFVPVHGGSALAQGGREYGIDPADPTSPAGGIGDPDEPIPGKTSVRRGSQMRGTTTLQARPVGDGRVTSGVGVWRLRVVLLGLKAYILRF